MATDSKALYLAAAALGVAALALALAVLASLPVDEKPLPAVEPTAPVGDENRLLMWGVESQVWGAIYEAREDAGLEALYWDHLMDEGALAYASAMTTGIPASDGSYDCGESTVFVHTFTYDREDWAEDGVVADLAVASWGDVILRDDQSQMGVGAVENVPDGGVYVALFLC